MATRISKKQKLASILKGEVPKLITVYGMPAVGRVLRPVGLTATERLSQPFELYLELRPSKPSTLDLDMFAEAIVGKSLSVSLSPSDHPVDQERIFHGEVAGLSLNDSTDPRSVPLLILELRPRLWRLSKTADCRYFANKTTKEIVSLVLDEHGLAGQYQWHSDPQTPPSARPHCWQYRESNLEFVHRLLEEDGYQYWFTFSRSSHELHLGRRPEALVTASPLLEIGPIGPDAEGTGRVAYLRRTVHAGPKSYVVEARSEDGMGRVVSNALCQQANHLGTVYDYAGSVHTVKECKGLAERRLDSNLMNSRRADGHGDFRAFHVGGTFRIDGTTVVRKTSTMRLVAIRHEATQATGIYSNRFEAVPGKAPFTLSRRHPKPALAGHLAATIVDGPDEAGRFVVQFDLDRSATRSTPITLSREIHRLFLPRKGYRVAVSFQEGEMELPVIERVLDHPSHWPFDAAANSQLDGIVTPGHGLLLNSDPQNLWVQLHSSGDLEVNTDGETRIETVKSRYENVGSDADWQIGSNSQWKIAGDSSTNVVGAYGVKAGDIVLEAGSSITLRVGSSFITISSSGVTINGSVVDLNPPGGSCSAECKTVNLPEKPARRVPAPKKPSKKTKE
jgi:type VI secretion system secreted protein VgrG